MGCGASKRQVHSCESTIGTASQSEMVQSPFAEQVSGVNAPGPVTVPVSPQSSEHNAVTSSMREAESNRSEERLGTTSASVLAVTPAQGDPVEATEKAEQTRVDAAQEAAAPPSQIAVEDEQPQQRDDTLQKHDSQNVEEAVLRCSKGSDEGYPQNATICDAEAGEPQNGTIRDVEEDEPVERDPANNEAEEKHNRSVPSDKLASPTDGKSNQMRISMNPLVKEAVLQIEIRWEATEHCSVQDLGQEDCLYLVPSPYEGTWEDDAWAMPQVFASGRPKGSVVMELTGLVVPSTLYELRYVRPVEDWQTLVVARSPAFSFSPEQAPQLTGDELEAAMAQSRQANATSTMQHYVNSAMAKTNEVPWNPLLSIEPEESVWRKLLNEMESGKRERVERAQQLTQQNQGAASAAGKVEPQPNASIGEEEFIRAVRTAFEATPGFIYAGAGVSMSPPSCSPSWWKLMNDLLAQTFARAPPEFASAVRQLAGGDVSRNPEDIMESYYLVFGEHLFTLFELLNKGEPNANHVGIAKMAKAGRLRAVLTTNFDIFIERALDQEAVAYTVVVTNDEFEQFCRRGCDGIAILKIHGTIDRPSTIVAVSNHYKMGKGFGGWKATAASRMMQSCPTLFLGYSGWDFLHKNYQEYWAAQAEVGGLGVFYMTNKHIPKKRPDLRKLVGAHIGDRLQMGGSALPDLLLELLSTWDSEGRAEVVRVHEGGDAVKAEVEAERDAFVRGWVEALPEVPMLTLMMIEAFTLNKAAQERMKRSKEMSRETEGVADTGELSAFFMQLAADMAAGKISVEEYMERVESASLEMTFVHLKLPKSTKEELKKLSVKATKTDVMFLDGPDAPMFKSWLPGLLLAASDGVEIDCDAEELLEKVLQYLRTRVLPLSGKTDRRSKVLRETLLFNTAALRCSSEAAAAELCAMFETFVEEGLEQNWDDARFNRERHDTLQKRVDATVTGHVDTVAVVEAQARLVLAAAARGDEEAVLRDALCLGVGLVHRAHLRAHELWDNPKLAELSGRLLASPDVGQAGAPTTSDLYEIEASLAVAQALAPVVEAVAQVRRRGGHEGACGNAEAALELATALPWLGVLPFLADGYAALSAQEHRGYYPVAAWHGVCQAFAEERLRRVADPEMVTDARVLQPLLAGLATVGENLGDFGMMREACERSLALTEGKVTELTPAPIPECLAAGLQARGDYAAASAWFEKALDGLRTSVMRQRADAIVLNACLVQATIDKKEALRWAVTTSPFFGSAQQFGTITGPGRALLVQQCEQWALELGYASLSDAEARILAGE